MKIPNRLASTFYKDNISNITNQKDNNVKIIDHKEISLITDQNGKINRTTKKIKIHPHPICDFHFSLSCDLWFIIYFPCDLWSDTPPSPHPNIFYSNIFAIYNIIIITEFYTIHSIYNQYNNTIITNYTTLLIPNILKMKKYASNVSCSHRLDTYIRHSTILQQWPPGSDHIQNNYSRNILHTLPTPTKWPCDHKITSKVTILNMVVVVS